MLLTDVKKRFYGNILIKNTYYFWWFLCAIIRPVFSPGLLLLLRHILGVNQDMDCNRVNLLDACKGLEDARMNSLCTPIYI